MKLCVVMSKIQVPHDGKEFITNIARLEETVPINWTLKLVTFDILWRSKEF